MDLDMDNDPLNVSTSTNPAKDSTTAAESLPSAAPVGTQQIPLVEASAHPPYTTSKPTDESTNPTVALDRLSIRRQPERLPSASAIPSSGTRDLPRQGPPRGRPHAKAFETIRDPIFDILSNYLLTPLLQSSRPSLANTILYTLYASRRRASFASPVRSTGRLHTSIRIGCRNLHSRNEQTIAIQLGTGNYPILAIRAASGTGETLVGAVIAARLASAGQLVIVTSTTNVDVTQFTDTLLRLEDCNHLHML
uniref:AAA_11 domain-containing protein n=1 Tax=Haemonchus contortus TaxID=6289 RepID=A0A7I4Z2A8_HAECO